MKILICLICLFYLSICHAEAFKIESFSKKIKNCGTCFAIDKHTIITAKHCIYDDKNLPCPEIYVIVNNVRYNAVISRVGEFMDLALCVVKDIELKPETLGEDINFGELIFIGSPKGEPIEERKGKLIRRYWEGTTRDLASVNMEHGLSGGPVTQNNKVVGLITSGLGNKNELDHKNGLFFPVSVIKWFLSNE